MEQINRKSQLGILAILILVISTSLMWYSRIDFTEQVTDTERINITATEAADIYGENSAGKEYFKKRNITYIKSRTYIPLVFAKDTISVSSWQTYSEKIN